MANQLPQGQIVPAARPISAFIEPQQTNIAQPNAPARLGGNGLQISTINRGGTTNVAGSYGDLAEALAPLNRNVTQALQNIGVSWAGGQMAAGERDAREQYLRAMANNDEQTESSEVERAAVGRRMSARDPVAGGFFANLNPYFQMGVDRGNSKLAAAEADSGFQAYVLKHKDRINYSAPDMGYKDLAVLQAEYTLELNKKYDVDLGSTGYQKYVIPSLNKAADTAQNNLLRDRKDYYDNVATGQAANLIRQKYLTAEENGYVEFNGQKIYKANDPVNYHQVLRLTAAQSLNNFVLLGSEVGDGHKRTASVYKMLQADAIYSEIPGFKKFVESLPGTEVEKGPDGKAIMGDDGQPRRLTMGAQFRSEGIDAEIKYENAVADRTKREREAALTGADNGFEDTILRAAQGKPEGPERKAAIDQAQRAWYEQYGRPQGISFAELTRRRNDLVKETNQLNAEATDPGAVSQFWSEFDQSLGSSFNAVEWRTRRIPAAAANIVDPTERARFESQARDAVTRRETEQAQMTPYSRARDAELNRVIDANIREWYDPSDPDQKRLIETSKQRQRSALTTRANAVIAAEEARLKRRLTETEVMRITRAAFYGDKDLKMEAYGSGPGGGKPGSRVDDLFPGSERSRAQAPLGPEGAVPERRYAIKDLGNITDGRVLKTYKQNFILTPEATLSAWEMVKKGQVLPGPLRQAISKSGAPSAADFVLNQMRLYRQRLYKQDPTGQEWRRFNPSQDDQNRVLRTSTRAAAGGNALSSAVSMVQSGMPRLAELGNTALNALTGTAPAVAGEMPGGPVRLPVQSSPVGSRPSGGLPAGGSRPSAPAAPAGRAPAAPVLPAPSGGQLVASAPRAVVPSAGASRVASPTMTSAVDLPPGWSLDERGMPRISMSDWQGRPSRVVAMRPLGPFSVGPATDGGGGGWSSGPAVAASHAEAGSGYTIPGAKDAHGRPVILSRAGANSLAAMVAASGGQVKYSDIASGQRSEAKNRAVGGAKGSTHLEGNGMDIHGTSIAWIRKHGAKYGWHVNDYDGTHGGHVEFRGGGSAAPQGSGGSAPVSGTPAGYLKRLAYLETRIRNIPNAEGSPGRGYFQAFPPFAKEAIAASGGIDPRDADYGRSSQATWAWIVKHRPTAAEAIKRGDYDTADRILRPTWPSLPGGSQAQPDEVQREARRYLRS